MTKVTNTLPLIKAKINASLYYIPIMINDIKANALIDTGATISAISEEFIKHNPILKSNLIDCQ